MLCFTSWLFLLKPGAVTLHVSVKWMFIAPFALISLCFRRHPLLHSSLVCQNQWTAKKAGRPAFVFQSPSPAALVQYSEVLCVSSLASQATN